MSSSGENSRELTMAVLGCGTMGIAILSGILADIEGRLETRLAQRPLGFSIPGRFIACVRRPESAEKVEAALGQYLPLLQIAENENVPSVQESDIIILACKPSMASEILSEPGMRDALKSKLLVSILAGVTVNQIHDILYPLNATGQRRHPIECTVVRAMPNTAAEVRESMTVINTTTPPLSPELTSLLTWIFRRIGHVTYLPPATMDACTALCGSGPAFFTLVLEAAADGAVAMGVPRQEALRMAAQTMKGAAELVLAGEHPALVRDKVGTPGGCTMGGLLVLEEGAVRGTVARAVREAAVVAGLLGEGVQRVNGTRR